MAAIGSSPSVALTRRYGRALLAPGAAILGSPDALAQPLLALLSGRDLDIITTGASSAAGAGGVGVTNTFPALLTRRLNKYVAAAPGAGRARNFNMAHGDTNSLFAAMTMDSHFPAANGSTGALSANEVLVLWEYSINDPVANFKHYTAGAMRLSLSLSLSLPPALTTPQARCASSLRHGYGAWPVWRRGGTSGHRPSY